MGEFVKKTRIGYKAVEDSSPECTHVILTKEEYDQLTAARERALWEARQDKRAAQIAIEQAREHARQEVQRARADIAQEMDRLRQYLAEEKMWCEYYQGLNENLKRICRERANADRKLRPKKEHTGFVVVSSCEKEIRYKKGQKWITSKAWETVLQTPFSVGFTEEQVKRETSEILPALLAKLGITAEFGGTYSELQGCPEFAGLNTALNGRLRANFRQGYWETMFLHTKALGVVPAEMMA